MIRRIARVAALSLVLAGCSSDPNVEDVVVTKTAVKHGEALFSDPGVVATPLTGFSCATCHQASSDATDPRVFTGAPLAGAAKRPTFWAGQENDLLRSINACRRFFMGDTLAWTPDDEPAKAMYAYITSLPDELVTPAPFTVVAAVGDLPAGDGTKGEQVYVRACAQCHGALHTGEGRIAGIVSKIPDETIAEHEADGFDDTEQRVIFVEKVRHGGFFGYGGNMPPFSAEVLSDAEMGDLLAYLELY